MFTYFPAGKLSMSLSTDRDALHLQSTFFNVQLQAKRVFIDEETDEELEEYISTFVLLPFLGKFLLTQKIEHEMKEISTLAVF